MDEDYNAPEIVGDVLFANANPDALDVSEVTLDDIFTGQYMNFKNFKNLKKLKILNIL